MKAKTAYTPPARQAILDTTLTRPDWTKSGIRDPNLLWLDKNENTDPVMSAVIARVLDELDPGAVGVYPDCAPLYHALAEHLGVSPYQIVLAPGSDGVIGSVFRSFISPGDLVLHTNPTYQMYAVYCRMSGAATAPIEYEAGKDGPYLPPEKLISEIRARGPKLVCLPNPDSPTGTAFTPDAFASIVESALDVGAALIADEAYHPFFPQTAIPLIADYPNVIVARTFSKAWAMTGLRLGYAVTTPETAVLLHKVRPNYEVNEVGVQMAVRMIKEFEHEMLASVKRLNAGRDAFDTSMRELGFRTLGCHGSFTHVAFGEHADKVHAALKNIVLYRQNFSEPCLNGFSRFSSTTIERFQPVIDAIRRVVRPNG